MSKHADRIIRSTLYGVILGILAGCISHPTGFKLVSISISPSPITVAKAATQTLTVTGTFNDGTTADVSDQVFWKALNSSVVSIEKNVVTGTAIGHTTITATTSDHISAKATVTVTHAELASIYVTPANPSIANGTQQQFVATGHYADSSTEDVTGSVTWSSSNTGIATISNAGGSHGLATGVAMGTATITAMLGTISGNTSLTITAAELVSISVTPANPSVASNTQLQFTAIGNYSDGSMQDITTLVSWESSDETVATISNVLGSEGLATTIAAGSTTITAGYDDYISGSTTLTVTTAMLVSIDVTPTNPSIPNGTTQQFTATGTFDDSSTQDITTVVTWSSSDMSIATISNTAGSIGLATGVSMGSATITATSGLITGNTTLTVDIPNLVSISVTPTNPSIRNGTLQQFTATGTYTDNSTQDITVDVTWSSSNTGVATISNAGGSEGLATSVAPGATTITATLGLISGNTTLTVLNINLLSIDVTPTNPSIANGTSQQFTATGHFDDSSTRDLTTQVTWDSSDMGVATISNTSGTNGHATSVSVGPTTITATLGLISGNTTLTVTSATIVSIDVTPANPSIPNGTTQQFVATGTFSDLSVQDITVDVVWSSSDMSIATISNTTGFNGLATAVAEGPVTITATFGLVSGNTTLTITPAVLASIAVTPADPSIDVSATQQFTAMGTYTDNSTQDITTSVTWNSSNTSKATIDINGLATGIAHGSTTITATLGLISGNTVLTVKAALDHVTISPTTSVLRKNHNLQLTGTAHYTDSSTANVTGDLTRWTSSAPGVIKVNQANTPGLIRAVSSSGSSTITFTYTENAITKMATLLVTAEH